MVCIQLFTQVNAGQMKAYVITNVNPSSKRRKLVLQNDSTELKSNF
jgi:hypothetical protein